MRTATEISTRIWLDQHLWNQVAERATAEGTTVRELIPRLLGQHLSGAPAANLGLQTGEPAVSSSPQEPGPPVVMLADAYRCGVCGAEVRPGGLSMHLGKHTKERQAAEAERS